MAELIILYVKRFRFAKTNDEMKTFWLLWECMCSLKPIWSRNDCAHHKCHIKKQHCVNCECELKMNVFK